MDRVGAMLESGDGVIVVTGNYRGHVGVKGQGSHVMSGSGMRWESQVIGQWSPCDARPTYSPTPHPPATTSAQPVWRHVTWAPKVKREGGGEHMGTNGSDTA